MSMRKQNGKNEKNKTFQLYFHVNEKTKWEKMKEKKQVQQNEGFQLYFHVNEKKMGRKMKKKQVQQKKGFQLYFHVNEKNYFSLSLTRLLTLSNSTVHNLLVSKMRLI